MSYRDSVRSSDGLEGLYILQPDCQKFYYAASWKGINTFRPFPSPDGQGGFMGIHMSTEPNHFSESLFAAETVVYSGQHRKVTFVSEWPGKRDIDESPAARLYRAIRTAWKDDVRPDWRSYIDGRGAYIQRPGKSLFMQGILGMHGGKEINRKNVVFMVKQSGRRSFEGMLNKINEEYQHPGDESAVDLDRYFRCPDPTHPERGGFITFEPMESTAERNAHYAAGLARAYPVDSGEIQKSWQPWDQIIRFMQPKEQIDLFLSMYPPEILQYAFADTDLLPKNIQASYPPQGPVQSAPAAQPASANPQAAAGGSQAQAQAPAQAQNAYQFQSSEGGQPAARNPEYTVPEHLHAPAQAQAQALAPGDMPGYPQTSQAADPGLSFQPNTGTAGAQPARPDFQGPEGGQTFMETAAGMEVPAAAREAEQRLKKLNQGFLEGDEPAST